MMNPRPKGTIACLLRLTSADKNVPGKLYGNWLQTRIYHSSQAFRTAASNGHLFNYTSGRWLYDEQLQLQKRHVKFNVKALQQTAEKILGFRCTGMTKLAEGLYNKVFSLKLENEEEILARIPNPNAGHPKYVVASEVATLDFLRNVLDIPVPEVVAWSVPGQTNDVGVDYFLMKKMQGRQLSDVWPGMSEAQRFGLVKNVVQIEAKLSSVKFSGYGSVHFREGFPNRLSILGPAVAHGDANSKIDRYATGPTTQRGFWVDGKGGLDIDRGPWKTAAAYLSAIANRESRLINAGEKSRPQNERHLLLLEQFLSVLPYTLPPKKLCRPVLWYHDLHADNIFVDETNPSKITGIIDWQGSHVAPLFLQAKFPSIFDSDDGYSWGAVHPELPEDFDSLSANEQEEAEQELARLRLKKFYEMASRKFNPGPVKAMRAMHNDDDPICYIFHLVGSTSVDGPIALRQLLIWIYEKWDLICAKRGIHVRCPIRFAREEIVRARHVAKEWAEAFNELEHMRIELLGEDGWVSHEEFEEAKNGYDERKEELDRLQQKINEAAQMY